MANLHRLIKEKICFYSSVFVGEKKMVRFSHMGPETGQWPPTNHQLWREKLVFPNWLQMVADSRCGKLHSSSPRAIAKSVTPSLWKILPSDVQQLLDNWLGNTRFSWEKRGCQAISGLVWAILKWVSFKGSGRCIFVRCQLLDLLYSLIAKLS